MTFRFPLRRRATHASMTALTLGLGLLLAAHPAAAQSISGAAASTSGSTANGGDGNGSVRSSVVVQTNNPTTFKTRYAWNISADVGVGSTKDSNATARHELTFDAVSYTHLTLPTNREV